MAALAVMLAGAPAQAGQGAVDRAEAGASERPLTIVTLGTSLTARGGWQKPLEGALGKCLARPVETRIVARSGETSRWGLAAIEKAVAAKPDVVLIEFSANDSALHRFMSLRESRATMRAILERLASVEPRPRVIVMGMNPLSGLRGAFRPFLAEYLAAHASLAREMGAEFIDHGPAWEALPRRVRVRAIPDGVHPDPAMAARVMVPTLVEAIAGRACGPGANQ